MSRRQKTTIYLDDGQYRRLKSIAEQKGETTAAQIRAAVDDYLARRGGRRLPKSLGSAASGRGDLSEKAEKLLRGLGRR